MYNMSPFEMLACNKNISEQKAIVICRAIIIWCYDRRADNRGTCFYRYVDLWNLIIFFIPY